ncbi:MAG TPA: N-acetylornithine carbamoyltransferase [Bacteroidia bacterium]|jgi:N-succinyl-L-ornithine transcarbamylase|nr:N-acetylornithine carbamoyltransferase [Bacteroidia bacterium]
MKHFTSVHDVKYPVSLIMEAIELKKNPHAFEHLGKHKTVGLLFLNPSLRTRLSSQKAAQLLGMNAMVMNMDKEGWALEWNDGAIMNGNKTEHIKDAAGVLSTYFDIVGIRCFPTLTDREADYSEHVIKQLIKYSTVPVISLESATLHPFQSLADSISIYEKWNKKTKPKVVLTWAPHVKALPQAVSNSFAEWMKALEMDFTITHPKGYELAPKFTKGVNVENDQQKALKGADFVYVKNWSAYEPYGQMPPVKEDWLLSEKKMQVTNNAYVMHCLPVRRNVELPDELLDGKRSLIPLQAENRLYSAAVVMKRILESMDPKQKPAHLAE